jgi:hypothetical protein
VERPSRLLGTGHAPPCAIDGGSALRLPAATNWKPPRCLLLMPGSAILCQLLGGHLCPHEGGGWRWHDDGRSERLPRIGG